MQHSETSRQKLRLLLLREWLRIAATIVLALLLPLVLFVVVAGGSAWQLNRRDNDLKNAPLQTGTAPVMQMRSVPDKRGFSVNLTFRVNGQDVSSNAANDERLIWTKVGDTVPVTYRVGRSGTIYIENWQAPPHKVSLSR